MRVIALADDNRIRAFLRTDRFFADYALGDLDPAHFPFTEWFGAEEDGELRALVMLYNDLTPPIFFATGEARGIEAILDQAVNLPEIGISIREEHLSIVEKFYRVEPIPMLKMALVHDERNRVFPSRVESETARRTPISLTRLDVSHMPLLEELYSHGGGDAFRRRSLEWGVFYGVFAGRQLVSIAGTHIVSDNERIAALGNVMTHPAYRGRGLATLATSAVCAELLDRGIELIGLSVGRSNEAAIRVYEKIGFKRHVPFYEGTASRIEIKDRNDQA
ncbi:MAG TPA: GNAT family N-acetyltransferase [Anaerolineae bacterium]|nr:GNAT family N-acetyltransferase [Anaerolineae bacterium]